MTINSSPHINAIANESRTQHIKVMDCRHNVNVCILHTLRLCVVLLFLPLFIYEENAMKIHTHKLNLVKQM